MSQSLRLSLLLFLIALGNLSAQDSWISERGAPLNTVDMEVMPRIDIAKLNASSRSTEKESTAYKFAEAISHSIDANSKGTWETLDNGDLLWRQRVLSPGAYSLNFGITQFYLPRSAKLFLYDQSKSYVVGPLTNKDNEKHRQWWSPIIPGEEVTIEVQIKAEDRAQLELEITKVNHDYKGFGAAVSGSCNIDVACGGMDDETLAIIDRFRDEINSVGMYTLNGIEQCSGSLINNARNDCTPYFLTANHCEVRENNAASVVVYWNYQQSTCRLPGSVESGRTGDGPRTEFNSGATVKANYDQSDLTLLLLDDNVDPATNPFFASFDFDPNTPRVDAFFHRVEDWDLGTTEGGSSGSPLFNMQKQVIGKLTGGDAACGNDLQDDYGMLKLSWEGGGTSETRLKDWLDPDNTGVTQIAGRYCVDVVRVSNTTINYCTLNSRTGSTQLVVQSGYVNGAMASINNQTQGISATLDKNDVVSGDTINVDINVLLDFQGQDGEVVIRLTDESGSTDFPITLIVNDNVPSAPANISPADGTQNINFEVDFAWESSGFSHELELSNTEDFSSVIRKEIIERDQEVTLKSFEPKTIYYWRVKSTNECGVGAYSNPTKFTTGDIECKITSANDLPIEIGEEAGMIMSFIDIVEEGIIADVNVSNLKGLHTWIGDLSFFLISPAGTEVRLAVSPCDDEDNFDISYDDESDNIILPCPLFDDVAYRPLDALSAFDGESSLGRWTLRVDDDARLDGGSLDGWDLELCLNLSQGRSISLSPNELLICENNPTDTFRTEGALFGDYEGDIILSLIDSEGNNLDATFNENPLTGSGSKLFGIAIPNNQGLENQASIFLVANDNIASDTTTINIALSSPTMTPELISPSNAVEGVAPRAQFEWLSVDDVSNYRLVLSTDEAMEAIVIDTVLSATAYEVTNKLALDQQYYWTVTAIGECNNSVSPIQSFRTDLTDVTIDPSLATIKIYPNPSSGLLFIDNTIGLGDIAFTIINSLGGVLHEAKVESVQQQLDLSNYESGVYLVRLVSEKGILVKRIIKTQ